MTTYHVAVINGKKYVQWSAVFEGAIGDGLTPLPEGEPFMGVPWEELTEGKVIQDKGE